SRSRGLELEVAPVETVVAVAGVAGKIELRGQDPAALWLDLQVVMACASGVQGRHDAFEMVAPLAVGELVPAVAVAAIVVLAVLVGVPHIDQRVCERLALRRKHASADDEALRLAARLHERGAKRGIGREERSLGLARRHHAAGLGEALERNEQRGTKHATTGKDHGYTCLVGPGSNRTSFSGS